MCLNPNSFVKTSFRTIMAFVMNFQHLGQMEAPSQQWRIWVVTEGSSYGRVVVHIDIENQFALQRLE